MTIDLSISFERNVLQETKTNNCSSNSFQIYDYGIINFIKPINELRVTSYENNVEEFQNIFTEIHEKVDNLFNEVFNSNKLLIPTGLHNILDNTIENQNTSRAAQNTSEWSARIAREHFED